MGYGIFNGGKCATGGPLYQWVIPWGASSGRKGQCRRAGKKGEIGKKRGSLYKGAGNRELPMEMLDVLGSTSRERHGQGKGLKVKGGKQAVNARLARSSSYFKRKTGRVAYDMYLRCGRERRRGWKSGEKIEEKRRRSCDDQFVVLKVEKGPKHGLE